MDTSERIKQARAEFGLTQEAFGKLAGVSKAAVSQWERGLTTPKRDSLLSLQKRRGLSPEWITNGAGEMLQPVSDSSEIMELWSKLPPEERAVLLPLIRLRASMHTTTQPAAQDRRQDDLPVGTERRFIRPGTFSFHQTGNQSAKAKHDKKK